MGEAKRRGTFEQRREQAQAKRAALFAVRPPEPERPVLALPRRNLREAAVMMAALDSLAMSQGVFIIRPRPNAEGQGCRASRHTLDPLVGASGSPNPS
jgi:hypothetical protein